MDLEYRLKHDENFAILYQMLGEPSPLGESRCLNCGKEIDFMEDDEAVVVMLDVDSPYPDQWDFCSAKCFKQYIEKCIEKHRGS